MIEPADFHESLRRHGLTFFTGVPDSLLKDLCAYITDQVPASDHVINANEGSAVALAAGHHLATGRIPVVYLQNSGIGNAVNPLLSLADPAVYAIPMLLLIGWRGQPGVTDEPQHVTQGRVMEPLLGALGVPYSIIGPESADFDGVLAESARAMSEAPRPQAILVRKGTFAPYASRTRARGGATLTRPRALEALLDRLGPDDLVVSTTGMTSREVFAYRETHGQGHERDFLTVGSMGHASQIALGIARRQPSRTVYCLDGDGAAIMHLGSLAIIGTQGPANLRHVIINNGAHDSVGGQPTAALDVDLAGVARACGYRGAQTVADVGGIADGLLALATDDGPTLLEIRVASDAHTAAGRPSTTPIENKLGFMRVLGLEP